MSTPLFTPTAQCRAIAALLTTLAFSAYAQDTAPTLETVEVRSATGGATLQDLPTSATVLDGAQLRDGTLQVNLSEGLGSVPGLQIKNRQNYAQDLQLSVRGYGARSTFGVRGVRIYVDGIPATLPDGQGSLSHIDISSLERIEVLRGPYSALYGNSAGGVISVFTETPEGRPFVEGGVAFGSDGQKRVAAKAGGQTAQGLSYVVSASRFLTDGYRDHSAADRNVANAKLSTAIGDDARLTITANAMQTDAQDPQGLGWSDWQSKPRSVSANTLKYDTRKSLQQTQMGATYERQLNGTHSVALTAYAGHRSMEQYQSIPPTTQDINTNPAHAGAVIDMSRDYAGMDARWMGKFTHAPLPVTVTAGLAVDYVQEDRQGYNNYLGSDPTNPTAQGIKGALRRDEINTIYNIDPYVHASWKLAPRWTLDTGLRYSSVKFKVQDHYIASGNPDDSDRTSHRQWLPVVSLAHQLSPHNTVYASVGRGFETPTLAEMSYRTNGSGMNTALRPSTSTQYELGYRQRLQGAIQGNWSAAVFRSDTNDEIVSAGSSGGRATYYNAGQTRRQGLELQGDLRLNPRWQVQAAYTWLDATFRDTTSKTKAGYQLPGLAQQQLFVAANYQITPAWKATVSAQHSGSVQVNDLHTAPAAPAYTIAAASMGYRKDLGAWTLNAFARVDNLFDKQYVGSVIVGDSNQRFYETAPGRTWSTGVNLRYNY